MRFLCTKNVVDDAFPYSRKKDTLLTCVKLMGAYGYFQNMHQEDSLVYTPNVTIKARLSFLIYLTACATILTGKHTRNEQGCGCLALCYKWLVLM